ELTRLDPARRTRRGIVRTFQRVAGFRGLTVAEHRAVARAGAFRPRRDLDAAGQALLADAGVDAAAAAPVDALPAAERRLVDMARALWTGPEVLLLDEPFAGLDEAQSAALLRCLHACRRAGLALLVVEHRLHELVSIAERLLVLDGGRLIADGGPGDVLEREEVVRSYQGGAAVPVP
ncbi:MAG TPA: ATP-binding cassette domain-containing protein, partial [Longimicrobium sp.]|nr:ATP-binding cassette domain-containing protein [Longimicrobium sp.]